MFLLRTFGGLALERDGVLLDQVNAQRKALAMLAVLAAAGEAGVGREKVMLLLWPESAADRARGALKQMLHSVRRQLGSADAILGTAELRLNPELIKTDLARFCRAVEAGDAEGAVSVYHGPFLDGVHLDGAPEFDEWLEQQRAGLARDYHEALERLACAAEAGGDPEEAAAWWRRLQVADPLNGRVALRLMQALEASGDRAASLRHASVHEALLREELGIGPDPALTALAERLRVPANPLTETAAAAAPAGPRVTAGEVLAQVHQAERTPGGPGVPAGRGAGRGAPRNARRRLTRAASLLPAALAVTLLVALAARSGDRDRHADSPRPLVVVLASETGADAAAARLVGSAAAAVAHRLAAADVAAPLLMEGLDGSRGATEAGRVGAGMVIAISARRVVGTAYLEATLTDARSGALLWRSPRVATLPDGEMEAADVLAERSATAVAVRLDPAFQNWISASSEPSSIESYRDFRSALRMRVNAELNDAVALLARVMARDTAFTMAAIEWALNARSLPAVSPSTDSVLARLKTSELKPHDRAIVDYLVARRVGDGELDHAVARGIGVAAPRSEWRILEAGAAARIGRPGEAVRVLDELGPNLGWLADGPLYWRELGSSLHFLGAHERELAEMAEARRRFPANRLIVVMHVKALAALGREEEVLREVNRALAMRPRRLEEVQPMYQAIVELRAHGYPDAARRLAVWTAELFRDRELAPTHQLRRDLPLVLFEAGFVSEARAALSDYLAIDSTSAYAVAMLGAMYAAEGDRAAALRVDARLADRGVPEEVVLFGRAGIAAWLGDRERAVHLLAEALRAGLQWRPVLHLHHLLQPLSGYEPFEELIRPSD
jgi:DNA-binding SARP family transcriptional activator